MYPYPYPYAVCFFVHRIDSKSYLELCQWFQCFARSAAAAAAIDFDLNHPIELVSFLGQTDNVLVIVIKIWIKLYTLYHCMVLRSLHVLLLNVIICIVFIMLSFWCTVFYIFEIWDNRCLSREIKIGKLFHFGPPFLFVDEQTEDGKKNQEL